MHTRAAQRARPAAARAPRSSRWGRRPTGSRARRSRCPILDRIVVRARACAELPPAHPAAGHARGCDGRVRLRGRTLLAPGHRPGQVGGGDCRGADASGIDVASATTSDLILRRRPKDASRRMAQQALALGHPSRRPLCGLLGEVGAGSGREPRPLQISLFTASKSARELRLLHHQRHHDRGADVAAFLVRGIGDTARDPLLAIVPSRVRRARAASPAPSWQEGARPQRRTCCGRSDESTLRRGGDVRRRLHGLNWPGMAARRL